MTLALLVPRDYRHDPVLVRFRQDDLGGPDVFYFDTVPSYRTVDVQASLDSFSKCGGEILRLHRDDDTNPSRRPRP